MRTTIASFRILPLVGAIVLVVAASAAAQDWPGFRGANGGGRVTGWPEEMSDPKGWPESLKREWRIPVGLGHASPVVQGDTVFVFSREGAEEVLRALRAASGEEIWRSSYGAPYTMNPAAVNHGPGPKGTPELAAGRIFTLGISGILSAWDAADGSLLWRRPPDSRFTGGEWPLYGAGSSPRSFAGAEQLLVHPGRTGQRNACRARGSERRNTVGASRRRPRFTCLQRSRKSPAFPRFSP